VCGGGRREREIRKYQDFRKRKVMGLDKIRNIEKNEYD